MKSDEVQKMQEELVSSLKQHEQEEAKKNEEKPNSEEPAKEDQQP